MEGAQPSETLGLLVIVAAGLAVIVYVFLRIAGIVGPRGRKREHPPPRTPLG